jgi:hypothetical protein
MVFLVMVFGTLGLRVPAQRISRHKAYSPGTEPVGSGVRVLAAPEGSSRAGETVAAAAEPSLTPLLILRSVTSSIPREQRVARTVSEE